MVNVNQVDLNEAVTKAVNQAVQDYKEGNQPDKNKFRKGTYQYINVAKKHIDKLNNRIGMLEVTINSN